MNILVTGAHGFVGKNLCLKLYNIYDKSKNHNADISVMEYDLDTEPSLLDEYCAKADFVFNLAGVNRPIKESEYIAGNYEFTSTLLDTLKKHRSTSTIMMASTIQAALDNPYGKSKKAGEDLLLKYEKETGSKVLIYRFPNLFGKWCKPNYNSVIATFCNNIANDLPITVNDRNTSITFAYIDDVANELVNALQGKENREGNFCKVQIEYKKTLGEIVDLLYSFKASRDEINVPDMSDSFVKKLYATYLSYLPTDKFSYPLKMNVDSRGSFTEIIRTLDRGQFSVNVSKAGIVKGNHWHNTKSEKFLVVSGKGVIRFRKIGDDTVYEYFVSGDKLEIVDVPTGYTHNIENIGDADMVTFMWSNELFDPNNTDTYFEEV